MINTSYLDYFKETRCLRRFFGTQKSTSSNDADIQKIKDHTLPIEAPVSSTNLTREIKVMSDDITADQTQSILKDTGIVRDVKTEEPKPLDYRSLIARMFTKDEKEFDQDFIQLKADLLKITPLREMKNLIDKDDQNKALYVEILYVFFGLKPALIEYSLTKLDAEQEEIVKTLSPDQRKSYIILDHKDWSVIKGLQDFCPDFFVDDEKGMAVIEHPLPDFDPRKFLLKLPCETLKDSAWHSWNNQQEAHRAYFLGYGPTFHVYDLRLGKNIQSLPYTDEHYKLLGKALISPSEELPFLDDKMLVEAGKQYLLNKKTSENSKTSNINKRIKKLFMGFCIDDLTANTEYWKWGFMFRERLLKLFDIPESC